jgi:hypothetical protein
VEVDDDHRRLTARLCHELFDKVKRVHGDLEEELPLQVDDGDLRPIAGVGDCQPPTGRARPAQVGGAKDPVARLE